MQCRRFRGRGSAIALALTLMLLTGSGSSSAGETSLGLGFGATAGLGVQADITFQEFTRNVPLSLRVSGAYSGRDGGNALEARSVFINDNTNGTPEESANTTQFRFDLLFPVATLKTVPVQLGAGVRKAFFTATFDFVGGNEKFDVTSEPWGAGLFAESSLEISDRFDVSFALGADYFFKSRLEGHDTAYEPDGDHVNPRNNYSWDDADNAINQPRVEWFGLIALRARLGG